MDSLKSYLKSINHLEQLTESSANLIVCKKRQLELELVQGNLKLVVKIAKEHANLWPAFDVMDFIQEGNIALMKCAKAYQKSRGKFITYAGVGIRVAIMNFIKQNTGAVRLYNTNGQRKVFSNLTNIKHEFEKNGVSLRELASDYDVPIDDLESILGSFAPMDLSNVTVESPEDSYVRNEDHQYILDKIDKFKDTLTPRQLIIFEENMYRSNRSLAELAHEWKISKQAVWKTKERVIELARDFFNLDDLKRIQVGEVQ